MLHIIRLVLAVVVERRATYAKRVTILSGSPCSIHRPLNRFHRFIRQQGSAHTSASRRPGKCRAVEPSGRNRRNRPVPAWRPAAQ